MNDTLDVLRYWLPGHETAEFYAAGGNMSASDCDHLCAELRRKYLERDGVMWVETRLYENGARIVVTAGPEWTAYEGVESTELLATIEAGKRLREALEPGEGT